MNEQVDSFLPKEKDFAQFVHLHLETVHRKEPHSHIENEWIYEVAGKSRPMLVFSVLPGKERGSRWFLVLPITSKYRKSRRHLLLPIGNYLNKDTHSYVEMQLYKVPENLLDRVGNSSSVITQCDPLVFLDIVKRIERNALDGQMQFKPIKGFPGSESEPVD